MTASGKRESLAPTDPFSPLVRSGEADLTGLLRAQGFYRLKRDLQRYAAGSLGGRSYLISGHRGAGKTALVHGAIEEVRQEQRKVSGKRPLLVRLPAPALLDVPVPAPAPAADGKPAVPVSANEQVLRGITIGLFHALVDEYLEAMEKIAEDTELAANLRTLLQRDPKLSELRDLWFRAGRLSSGVLGCHADARDGEAGVHEIATLWQALQAWQRVIGSLKHKTDDIEDDERKRSETMVQSIDPSGLVNAFVGVGAGAAAGLALSNGSPSPLMLFAGSLVTLATFKTLEVTTTSSRTSKRNATRNFEEDMRIGSVARLLPRLVDQLRSLGLAPVFVIDELDKVKDLGARLEGLLDEVKQLTAEEAFFCFLVDRAYFEELTHALTATAYPVQQTWFTTRLFVSYGPDELGPWLATALASAATPGPVPASWEVDRELWRYLLLFRSQMHFHSLRLELARLDEAIERNALPPGHVRGSQYRGPIVYQLALEQVLSRSELARWVEEQPYNAQVAFDALYCPARLWGGLEPFAVTPEKLEEHLLSRLPPASNPEERPRLGVTRQDLLLLSRALDQLCRFLVFPRALEKELWSSRGRVKPTRWEELSRVVQDAVQTHEQPLLAVVEEGWQWCVDPYGRVRVDPAAVEATVTPAAAAAPANGLTVTGVRLLVEVLDRDLGAVGLDLGDLADRHGFLRTSPSYAGARRALLRLGSRLPAEIQQHTTDERTALEYGEMLVQALPGLVALVRGGDWLLALAHASGPSSRDAAWAARTLLSVLVGTAADRQQQVTALFYALTGDTRQLREVDGIEPMLKWDAATHLRGHTAPEEAVLVQEAQAQRLTGEAEARHRLATTLDPDVPPAPPTHALLAGIVANPGWWRVFAEPNSLAAWSEAAAFALDERPNGSPGDVRFAAIALARLGFIDLACWLDPDFGRERDLRSRLLARSRADSIFIIRIGEGSISADWPTLYVPSPVAAPPDEPIWGLGTWSDKQLPTIHALVTKADLDRPHRWLLDIGKVDDLDAALKPLEKLVTFSGAIGHVPRSLSARMPVLDARTPAELVAALRTPRHSAK